jgi:carbon monoxide dehydrogenase subunit G
MELSSTYTFNAPRQVVWDLLIDPAVVAACLPGCESLEPTGDDSYTAVLTVGIASITGQYKARVTLADRVEPESYRLVVDAKGRPGFVRGEAHITLADGTDGHTVVSVDGRGQMGGMIARVGQRLVGTVGKTMMDRFFDCLSTKVSAVSS